MSNHTPEPWRILPEEVDRTYIRIRGTKVGSRYKIANVLNEVSDLKGSYEGNETRANATRIVACVNACAGMADPTAEIAQLRADRKRLMMALEKTNYFFKHKMIDNSMYEENQRILSEMEACK